LTLDRYKSMEFRFWRLPIQSFIDKLMDPLATKGLYYRALPLAFATGGPVRARLPI